MSKEDINLRMRIFETAAMLKEPLSTIPEELREDRLRQHRDAADILLKLWNRYKKRGEQVEELEEELFECHEEICRKCKLAPHLDYDCVGCKYAEE